MSRRPFTGSCHCGFTRYIVYLTVPHTLDQDQRIYRCNCSICHKAGIFHTRVSGPDDFYLLSPLDPFSELGDYRCNEGDIHWFFCKTCGVRCLLFMGKSLTQEVSVKDLNVSPEQAKELGLDQKGDDEQVQVWKADRQGWAGRAKEGSYLSVNGHTIDQKQEGYEMAELTKEKKVGYVDMLRFQQDDFAGPRVDEPHRWGAC